MLSKSRNAFILKQYCFYKAILLPDSGYIRKHSQRPIHSLLALSRENTSRDQGIFYNILLVLMPDSSTVVV